VGLCLGTVGFITAAVPLLDMGAVAIGILGMRALRAQRRSAEPMTPLSLSTWVTALGALLTGVSGLGVYAARNPFWGCVCILGLASFVVLARYEALRRRIDAAISRSRD
jgi:hypothetical protein